MHYYSLLVHFIYIGYIENKQIVYRKL